jgi:hypothetical protein
MPLLPTTLTNGLLNLDIPSPPPDATTAAQRWFDAWWAYASGMVFLNPGTLAAARSAAQGPFLGILTGVCVPLPVPGTFFLALESAMRAAWLTLATPAFLTPPVVTATPSPLVLAPLMIGIVPVGLVSPTPQPSRILLSTLIDAWTRGYIAMTAIPAPAGPFS